jgi:2-iminoacetate synthase
VTAFELREETVRRVLEEGRRRAASAALPGPDDVLDVEDIAALHFSRFGAEELRAAAIERRGARGIELETFAPLYLTNTCDAECRMCGMRRDNAELERETATPARAIEQLRTLKQRGVLAVGLLTGEYRRESRRWAIGLTREALREAIALEFRHVLVNIGSLDDDELELLLEDLPRAPDGRIAPKVTMCTFQETYERRTYGKFMGTSDDNPRADFERRLTNFDRAAAKGMRVANPGVLLGLCRDLGYELVALALHVKHLAAIGLDEIYLSVPRLRQAAGAKNARGVSDDDFVRLVAILSIALPEAKIVITTRESAEVQRRVLPMVTVLSAGSSAVAPYDATGARFPLEASQFEVIDQRPIERILGEYIAEGYRFENYAPREARA